MGEIFFSYKYKPFSYSKGWKILKAEMLDLSKNKLSVIYLSNLKNTMNMNTYYSKTDNSRTIG